MTNRFGIVNYAEVAVNEVIEVLYEDFKKANNGFCDCPACRNRAMALALNTLQPCYVTSEAEYAVAKANFDSISERARLIAIVMDSIREVFLNPNHSPKESLVKRNQPLGFAFA